MSFLGEMVEDDGCKEEAPKEERPSFMVQLNIDIGHYISLFLCTEFDEVEQV